MAGAPDARRQSGLARPNSRAPRRIRWIWKLTVLAISLVVAMVLAEVGARAWLNAEPPEQTRPWYRSNWKGKLCRRHPEIGRIHKSNARVTLLNEFGKEVEILTDENGLRICDEAEASTQGPVIAVLGDSFVEAAVTACPDTFCAALSRGLNGQRVLNCGVGGYSTAQAVNLGRLVVPKYDAELLILAVYAGNDLRDNYFWQRESKRQVEETSFWDELAVFRLIRNARADPDQYAFKGYDWRSFFDAELLLYDPQLEGEVAEKMREAEERSLSYLVQFAELASQSEAEALVVLIPSKAMVYQEPSFISSIEVTPWAYDAIMDLSRRGFDFDRVRSRWRDLATEANLPFLDLTDAFRRDRNMPLYGKMDRHWSGTGQQVAAEVVLDYLSRESSSRDNES